MKTVLFDIDGTLANIEHRRVFLDSKRPDWKRFNDAIGDDTPNTAVVSLYQTLWNDPEYELILVTGRNEKFREVTEQWFFWNDIPMGEMFMRKDNDSRADHFVKQDILDHLLGMGKNIIFTVDDRQQVVDMWRRNGITCLQCDVGNF